MHPLSIRTAKTIAAAGLLAALNLVACAPAGSPDGGDAAPPGPGSVIVEETSTPSRQDEAAQSTAGAGEEGDSAATSPSAERVDPTEMCASDSLDGSDGAESDAGGGDTPILPTEVPPARIVFPYDTYLFVEILEERVLKSDSGGQTTSFAGETEVYEFDSEAGTLTGPLKGTLNEAAPSIVGRLVVTQIDRSKSVVGQLYATTESGQRFGAVTIASISSEGAIVLSVDGENHVLLPGEGISMADVSRGADDRLALGTSSRSLSVTNHGFQRRSSLTTTEP